MGKGLVILSLLMMASLESSKALEIQGVTLDQQVRVCGETLKLNGAGLRAFRILMIPLKIYVVAFYAPAPLHTSSMVLDSPGPLQFDFTFLRDVGGDDVSRAWTFQFAESISYTYPAYERERDVFIAMFGHLRSSGVERVRMIGTDTLVYDSGVLKGKIAGRDFQKAFLSLWFGSTPVDTNLKNALLGK